MTNIRYFKSFRDLPEVFGGQPKGPIRGHAAMNITSSVLGTSPIASRCRLMRPVRFDTDAHDAFAIRYRVI